jgi:hypothetical protein
MGVEFRLGHQDHKKVEDFLSRSPAGVSSIVLDTKAARYQTGAAEAARNAGVDVIFDPQTDRLCDPGFDLPGLAYYRPGLTYDVDRLAIDAASRDRLVSEVAQAHPELTTIATPPYFYASDDRSALLNVTLAEAMTHATPLPVRAPVVMPKAYGAKAADRLAREYYAAGVRQIDLKLSPLGGEDEGVPKIKAAFKIADAFKAAGLHVTLGQSGNIGRAAVALGHADSYSVGVGMREQFNYAGVISRQRQPPRAPIDGEEQSGVAVGGIYLAGLSLTLPRKVGRALLENTDLRTKIGCRIDECGSSVAGPSNDPRMHYLHARAAEIADMLAQPAAAWRAKAEMDRLRRALDLREMINARYLPEGARPIKTRTLQSLMVDIGRERASRTA